MVRKGNYTIYQGKEFRFVKEKDTSSVSLISNDRQDLQKGFEKYSDDVYIKNVAPDDLKEAYYIHPYAMYKGKEFDAIVDERNRKANLGTGDAKIAKELGFNRTDKYYYEKIVSINEVKIIEKREDISMNKG